MNSNNSIFKNIIPIVVVIMILSMVAVVFGEGLKNYYTVKWSADINVDTSYFFEE